MYFSRRDEFSTRARLAKVIIIGNITWIIMISQLPAIAYKDDMKVQSLSTKHGDAPLVSSYREPVENDLLGWI